MSVSKIALSNVRKRKGASISFFIMTAIASLMLCISLSLVFGMTTIYDKKVDEFNSPHYSNFILESQYTDDMLEFAKGYQGVTDTAVIDTLLNTVTWDMKKTKEHKMNFFMTDIDVENSFQNLVVIDKLPNKTQDSVILPLNFKTSGFKSGEKISFTVNAEQFVFTINGFFQDTLFGASTMDTKMVYACEDVYNRLAENQNFSKHKNLSVRFSSSDLSAEFNKDFNNFVTLTANESMIISYDASKTNAMMFITIMALVLLLFSIIIMVIAIIVVRFNIMSTVAEDITTIGALKSIGYKNKSLIFSQLLQYGGLALIGALLGSVISLLSFKFVGNIIASVSGLLWQSGANILPILITLLTILGLTMLITFITSTKFKKITPINALRQGESNHSFKKNVMPLEKIKMPLSLHLAVKRFCGNIKNNITLYIVSSLLIFVSILTSATSYNLSVDKTAMIKMVGLEMCNVYVQTSPSLPIAQLEKHISSDSKVQRTLLIGGSSCEVNGYGFSLSSTEEYSRYTKNTIIKGSYPKLHNEVVIGTVMAKTISKGIGDTLSLKINNVSQDYVVVGITQGMGTGGGLCEITDEAMLKHNAEYSPDTVYVYLNKGIDTSAYVDTLKAFYGNKVIIANIDESIDSILGSMSMPLLALSILMIATTIIVVGFMLFLIISALVRKEKRALGIMKALGYKNGKLMLQMMLSFLPSLVLGAITGIILGFTLTNPIMSIFFTSAGVASASFIIPTLLTLSTGFGIFAASVLLTFFISYKIKKISPQKLITE